MTEYEKNFPFRGKINEYRGNDIGKSFYIVGKFTEEGALASHNTGIFENSGFTTKQDLMDQNFVLCSNQYRNGNGYNQRLYFSSDPHDYQIDRSNNSLNQGAANLIYTQDEGIINLRYMTYFDNRNKFRQGDWKDIPINLDQIPMSDQVKSQNFIFNNNTYNLDNTSLYYSVPYEITQIPKNNTSSEDINFTFRGISTSTIGSCTYFPETSFSKTHFHLSNVEKINVWSGTSVYIKTHPDHPDRYTLTVPISGLDPSTTPGLCILTDYHFNKNNVLKLHSFNNYEYVHCNFLGTSGTDAIFNIYQRSLYDGESIPSTGLSGVSSITSELRNTRDNFGEISSENLRYYLIPYEAYGYFTGGVNLQMFAETGDSTPGNLKYFSTGVSSDNNVIYDPITSNGSKNYTHLTTLRNLDLNAYQKFYNYFVFLTSDYLKPTIWNTVSSNRLGVNTGNDITKFTWSTTNEAYQAFAYNYCTKTPYETCGNCYGLNQFHQDSCYVSNETRGILTGATKSLQGTPPLSSSEDLHDMSTSNNRILYFWWFFAMILILICYMLYTVYKIFTIEDYRERQTSESKTNQTSSGNIRETSL